MSLELRQVAKRYEGSPKSTIEEFSLSVAQGEFVVLLGPSGCGKSTLLRIVAGLVPATAGQVLIAGRDVTRTEPARRDVAMVFQNYALFPHFTVYENLAFGMRLRKVPVPEIERAVREAAQALRIQDLLGKRPKELSGGQRQRVALGRAMLRKASVILFDEPLSNLDAKLRAQLRAEIMQFHQRLGRISLYVTHDQLEAMTMADRIVILDGGVVQQVGAPLELYERPRNMFVADFLGAMNFFPGEVRVEGGAAFFQDAAGLKLEMPASAAARGGTPGGPVVLGLRPEDIYRQESFTGRGPALRARLDLVESLGDAATLHCSQGEHRFKVRLKHQFSASRDKTLDLVLDMNKAHFFKPTGENILGAGA